jgi:hypothetical protein
MDTDTLSKFLINKAILLKKGSLSLDEIKKISEFFLEDSFKHEKLDKEEKVTEKELLKYLSLGYFIYKNKSIINKEDDQDDSTQC